MNWGRERAEKGRDQGASWKQKPMEVWEGRGIKGPAAHGEVTGQRWSCQTLCLITVVCPTYYTGFSWGRVGDLHSNLCGTVF